MKFQAQMTRIRTLFLFAACALAALGQVPKPKQDGGANPIVKQDGTVVWDGGGITINKLMAGSSEPAYRYLLKYTTRERDYNADTATLVYCAGWDCNTPTKTVEHFAEFGTAEEAIKFVNDGFLNIGSAYLPNGVQGTTTWSGQTVSPAPKFVALYRVTPVEVVTTTDRNEIPQPPKYEEKIRVELKK